MHVCKPTRQHKIPPHPPTPDTRNPPPTPPPHTHTHSLIHKQFSLLFSVAFQHIYRYAAFCADTQKLYFKFLQSTKAVNPAVEWWRPVIQYMWIVKNKQQQKKYACLPPSPWQTPLILHIKLCWLVIGDLLSQKNVSIFCECKFDDVIFLLWGCKFINGGQ